MKGRLHIPGYLCKKNRLLTRITIVCFISLLLSACNNPAKNNNPRQYRNDSTRVARYIQQGDSIYKQKSSYSNFSKSLEMYDSAWKIASAINDPGLLAQAVFAKGRAYDAINNNPQETIDYYTEAARLYATLPNETTRSLYIKNLVAHSYDKVRDSANCIKILHELYNEISPKPDSVKQQFRFTVEMALISTVVKNYTLADSILKNLASRAWIKNDSTEYDYLNHYYLVKAKISVLQLQQYKTAYLDSLEQVLAHSRNLNDSMYYSNELWELYKAMGDKQKESYYLNLNNAVFNRFNSPESVREARDKLAKMELAAVEAKRKTENEKAEARKRFIYILAALVCVISLLAFFLYKQNKKIRRQQNEVLAMNEQLRQKNLQNELLNKEIHHRVKNNLQMIMSLVYMQENNTSNEAIKENMQSIRLRIESIARLHQQLMEQTDTVDLRKYIQYLVSSAANLVGDEKKVITHLDIEPLLVPQKISFPLGLIINELVTNSVKYAQPAGGALEIAVKIANRDNRITISYKDNGKPRPPGAAKKSLGLEIIQILTEQIDGTLETAGENLYEYTLAIPLTDGE